MAVRPGAAAERALWWRRPRNRWLALSGEISPELEGLAGPFRGLWDGFPGTNRFAAHYTGSRSPIPPSPCSAGYLGRSRPCRLRPCLFCCKYRCLQAR